MKITRIEVKNFKSFSDEILEIKDLTILIGANASGKSNTISLIRFLSNIINYGIDDAISLMKSIFVPCIIPSRSTIVNKNPQQ